MDGKGHSARAMRQSLKPKYGAQAHWLHNDFRLDWSRLSAARKAWPASAVPLRRITPRRFGQN